MIAIATGGNVVSTCAGMGGEWRRIFNINISAGDDCPGEWRKATHSNVTFCRVASDDLFTCSSANFSTNGISYQRVCGRVRGYQKGITVAFQAVISFGRTVDKDYVDGLSILLMVTGHCSIFGLLLVDIKKILLLHLLCFVHVQLIQEILLLLLSTVIIIVSQELQLLLLHRWFTQLTHYGMVKSVIQKVHVVMMLHSLGFIVNYIKPLKVILKHEYVHMVPLVRDHLWLIN